MASSIASIASTGDVDEFISLEDIQIENPKQTSVDKVGGILCHICNTIVGNKKEFEQHYGQHNTGCKEIIYTCVVCKKNLSSYPSFRGHCYLNHVVKNKFQCKYCPRRFCKMCILLNHVSAVHDQKCSTCSQKFTSKRELEKHKQIVHSFVKVKSNACMLCESKLDDVEACLSHLDSHCEMLYPCPICKEVLPNKLTAMKHLSLHFSEKLPPDITEEASFGEDSSIDILGGIRCCYCDSLHRNRTEINLHLKVDHPNKPIVYMCNVCNKIYEKYDLFGKHCYDHFIKGKFQCEHCPKTFPRLSLLVIHTEVFHIACSLDKPFGCERCGHGYMTSLRLKEHMRIVHEEEASRSRCMKPGCSATFDKPRDLVQHLKDHSPMLDNWCKQCGLQFTTIASAVKHLDTHRQTSYPCPICNKTFAEKYFMAKHIPTHFEAVLHICKTCGKAYESRRRFVQHLKSHANTYSHQCTFCSKSFLKLHKLTQHLNIHTGLKPYSCKLCSKTFTNYPNWSKHLSRVHNVDKAEIRRMNVELRTEALEEAKAKSSPTKPESGIESAGSELSDVHTFADDSDDAGSIADHVSAAIDRINALGDDNLDCKTTVSTTDGNSEFLPKNELEIDADENYIRAIVEDIDAMSGGLNAAEPATDVSKLEPDHGILQYADLMPMSNAVFDNIPAVSPGIGASVPGGLAEYGPDLAAALGEHELPHIDPLLTFTDHKPKCVQQLHPYSYDADTAPLDCDQPAWALPQITKPYTYEENNEITHLYIY